MTESDETYVAFGHGVNVGVNRSNNAQRIYGTGSRDPDSSVNLQYSGTVTIGGTMNNVYWLLGALGANVDGGSGPASYTHTYTPADNLPTFTCKRSLDFNIQNTEVFQGCVTGSATFSMSVNEPVTFSLECPFRYSKITTGTQTIATDTQAPFTFAGGTIELPTGTTIAAVQSMEFVINNTAEMVHETGSRFARAFTAKNREYNIRFSAAIKDLTLLKQFYNGTTGTEPDDGTGLGQVASMKLNFENYDGHTVVVTLSGINLNEDSLPTGANETVTEDITGWANSLTNVVYTNATETAPAEADNV